MQKVIKVGNSAGISLTKADLASLGLKLGDRVELSSVGRKGGRVKVKKSGNADLATWTDDFVERYRPALEELAKK